MEKLKEAIREELQHLPYSIKDIARETAVF